ncbi:glycosyltransferase family 8 protein [Streptococcus halichoeri]|uniref:glycosyltransferase family 8 protein n=3 Tax=Streptococcus halichoeri TaxID=254785 RepID=UPI001356935A|nr:glycosyltransferase family 8 protein [Streptococcus halichoeri]
MQPINLLFSIDDGYVDQFMVTLYSVVKQTPEATFDVYVLQRDLLQKDADIRDFCQQLERVVYHPVVIGDNQFSEAPTSDRYPETIYYRLLAHEFLPKKLERILYLDADILCLNDITSFYHMHLGDYLYAAASHTKERNVTELMNKFRLGNFEASNYVNSGVLLMNLQAIRTTVKRQTILTFIEEKGPLLFLPDQDILNALYGHQILVIADDYYNFDTRMAKLYYLRSSGQCNDDWIVANTLFLHFCGRDKPWRKHHRGHFGLLYKHYQRQALQLRMND